MTAPDLSLPQRRRWRGSRARNASAPGPLVILSLVWLAVIVFVAIFADLLAPYSHTEQSLLSRLMPPAFAGGDPAYLLGTDNLGRDVLSRLLHGTRMSVIIALAGSLIGASVGTLIGILALAWSARTRARVALTQGLFLGALGLGVIGLAVWRSLNAVAPEAGLMGGIAAAALVVNIAAALVLMRFREGDAHVSAIWLFSRNDAIANVGVIIAAALVAWTGQAWPDLLVAAIIALIFLHSAYLIVRRATEELRAQHASALERVVSK